MIFFGWHWWLNSVIKKEKQSEYRGKFCDFFFSSFLTWDQQKDFPCKKKKWQEEGSFYHQKKSSQKHTINEHIEVNTPSQNQTHHHKTLYTAPVYTFLGSLLIAFYSHWLVLNLTGHLKRAAEIQRYRSQSTKLLGVNLHSHYSSI